MDARWPKHAAKGRMSLVEGLIAVTPVLLKSQRGAPDPVVLREALRRWAFNPPRRDTDRPPEVEAALRCLARASLPMSALEEPSTVSRALDACGRKLDGSAAAAQYYRRRRRVFYAVLKYAVRERRLSANPLDGAEDREWRAPEVDHAVDRRRVANPVQMRSLLDAIRSVGLSQGPRLVALYGCMYYGMLRPSEAVSLLLDEYHLPAEGWGRLEFREVRSASGRDWTDDGGVHETRAPKGGPRNAVRRVPIPPQLVQLLREPSGAVRDWSGGSVVPYLLRCHVPAVHAVAGAVEGARVSRRSLLRRSPRRWPAGRTTSVIRWTAGLCALSCRSRCWGRGSSCCGPHNHVPGVSARASRAR